MGSGKCATLGSIVGVPMVSGVGLVSVNSCKNIGTGVTSAVGVETEAALETINRFCVKTGAGAVAKTGAGTILET